MALSLTVRLEVGCDDLKRSPSKGLRLILVGSSRDMLDNILERSGGSKGSGGSSGASSSFVGGKGLGPRCEVATFIQLRTSQAFPEKRSIAVF